MQKIHYDPNTCISTEYGEREGKILLRHTIDKSDIRKYLELNKKAYNAVPHKTWKSVMRKKNIVKVANIPPWLIIKWKNEGIDIFKPEGLERACKLLNSSEYEYLRTNPGRI